MTIIIPLPAIIGGLLSGTLYYLVSQQYIVGITAPFLPLFIIALCGMAYGRAGVMVAAAATAPLLLLLLEISDALLILATQIVPTVIMIRALMIALVRHDPPTFIWASLGTGVIATSFYGAIYYIAMIATDNSLYRHVITTMQTQVKAGFGELEPELAVKMEGLVTEVPHIIVALEFWGWTICMVGLVLFAQYVLETFRMQRRPMPHLRSYMPPNMLLIALGIAGSASFLSYQPLVHAGQTASIILLLPYFFSGLSVIHAKARATKHGTALLFGFYMFFMLTLWPLIFVTGYGLLRHLGHYSLPRSGTS